MRRALDDVGFVREQYASEENLAARKAAYGNTEGPDPRWILWQAIVEAHPTRVLEVGGGEGELAERIERELDVELVAVDQSSRMVEIQRLKGIDARVGDVRDLPFDDEEFDLAVAAWMLYHVPDVDQGLSELARVLRSGGCLVAVTNAPDHLQELHELAGDSRVRDYMFHAENAETFLRRRFAHVERHDAYGWVTMDDETIRRYAASWEVLTPILDLPLQPPLRIRRRPTILVAEKD